MKHQPLGFHHLLLLVCHVRADQLPALSRAAQTLRAVSACDVLGKLALCLMKDITYWAHRLALNRDLYFKFNPDYFN